MKQRADSILKHFEFVNNTGNLCFYVKWKEDDDVMIIYPQRNDLHLAGGRMSALKWMKLELLEMLEKKCLGEARLC